MTTKQESKLTSEKLVVPVYLDGNIVLDLLASIDGGFSVVEKITTRTATNKQSEGSTKADAGADFGVAGLLNFLKVNVGSSRSLKNAQDVSEQSEAERYHTLGSLLFRLRSYLEEEGLLERFDGSVDSWDKILPMRFVEVRGIFRLNPMIDNLKGVDRAFTLNELFAKFAKFAPTEGSGNSQLSQQLRQSQPGNQKNSGRNNQSNNMKPEDAIKTIRNFLNQFSEDLSQAEKSLTLIDLVELADHKVAGDYKAVISVTHSYLRGYNATELFNKEFTVFGKVVRKLVDETDMPIDLLFNTKLGSLGSDMLEQFIVLLNSLAQTGVYNIPEATHKITSPAVEILPIAIYV